MGSEPRKKIAQVYDVVSLGNSINFSIWEKLLAHHLHYNFPVARAIIKVNCDNLLPGAEGHIALAERNSKGGAKKRGTHVRMTIAIVPAIVMLVRGVAGSDSFKKFM